MTQIQRLELRHLAPEADMIQGTVADDDLGDLIRTQAQDQEVLAIERRKAEV